MTDQKEEKLSFKDRTKKFFSEKWRIILGTMSVGALLALIFTLQRKGVISADLNEKLYDALKEKREDIRLDFKSKTWQQDLERIDNQLRKMENPRRKICKLLSDEELNRHIADSLEKYTKEKEIFDAKRKGMSYEQYRKDPEYINLNKLYDTFDQARIERDHRNAIANPDKFPIKREHGTNLYKGD